MEKRAQKLQLSLVLVLLFCTGLIFAELPANQKLMAKRAAEMDAYRNMTERIMGLSISSSTTVVDFVTESDQIATSMNHFIKGIRIAEDQTVYYEDGTCEVIVEVTLSKVIRELQVSCDKYYKGGKWNSKSFVKMDTYTDKRVLSEIGCGAVRPQSNIPEPATSNLVSSYINPRGTSTNLPAIYRKYPPKNRLMAKRMATVDAYRKLAERVYGLQISSNTTVADFDVNMSTDIIRGSIDHHLKGMKVDEIRYQEDGVVEVQVSLTLKQVVKTLKKVCDEYYSKTGKKIKTETFQEITKQTKRRTITVLGMGSVMGSGNTTRSTSGMQGQDKPAGKRTTTTIIIEEPEVIEIK